jgi:hypothetical protein
MVKFQTVIMLNSTTSVRGSASLFYLAVFSCIEQFRSEVNCVLLVILIEISILLDKCQNMALTLVETAFVISTSSDAKLCKLYTWYSIMK